MLSRRASRAPRATSIMRSMPFAGPASDHVDRGADEVEIARIGVSRRLALRTSFDDGRIGIVQAANIEEEHGPHHPDIGQGDPRSAETGRALSSAAAWSR